MVQKELAAESDRIGMLKKMAATRGRNFHIPWLYARRLKDSSWFTFGFALRSVSPSLVILWMHKSSMCLLFFFFKSSFLLLDEMNHFVFGLVILRCLLVSPCVNHVGLRGASVKTHTLTTSGEAMNHTRCWLDVYTDDISVENLNARLFWLLFSPPPSLTNAHSLWMQILFIGWMFVYECVFFFDGSSYMYTGSWLFLFLLISGSHIHTVNFIKCTAYNHIKTYSERSEKENRNVIWSSINWPPGWPSFFFLFWWTNGMPICQINRRKKKREKNPPDSFWLRNHSLCNQLVSLE